MKILMLEYSRTLYYNSYFSTYFFKIRSFTEKIHNLTQQKIKNELQNIISGNGAERQGNLIKTTQSFLRRSQEAGTTTKRTEFSKEQEEKRLNYFIDQNNLWYTTPIDEETKIGEGFEQKVYLQGDKVIKLNDSIFYASWKDYLHNLLLHNYFFSNTAYTLKGFKKRDDRLFVVVEQVFVQTDRKVNLDDVEDFLRFNGFLKPNPAKNDYKNKELGIILEDMHDENVLQNDKGALFFIDTVFYLTPDFYKSS